MKDNEKDLYQETIDRFADINKTKEQEQGAQDEEVNLEFIELGKQTETDHEKFGKELYDVYFNKLLLNNDLNEATGLIWQINRYTLDIQTIYLEKTLDFINENQLYINYFCVDEILSYSNNELIKLSEQHQKIREDLEKEFFFSFFDETEINEDVERLYLSRKSLMEAFRNRNATADMINKIAIVGGTKEELDLYRILMEYYNKRTLSQEEAKKILSDLNDYLFEYPSESSAILLYLSICFTYEIEPRIVEHKLKVGTGNESKLTEIIFSKFQQTRLPYKNYDLALVIYGYDSAEMAKIVLENERHFPIGQWDIKAIRIKNGEKIENNVILKRVHNNFESENFKYIVLGIVIFIIMLLMFLI